jgi:hypothetical protein
MLTPHLNALLKELQNLNTLNSTQMALLNELKFLSHDEVISKRCLELAKDLPPVEVPAKGQCFYCGRPL